MDLSGDRPWRIVRFVLTSGLCILCAGLLVYFRRKLFPLVARLPSVNLLILSFAHEILVTIPLIAKSPHGDLYFSEDWWMGVNSCRIYVWSGLYLGQSLGVVLVAITLHEWIQMHNSLRNSIPGKSMHLAMSIGPWVVSFVLSLRLVAFTNKIGIVTPMTNTTHECQIDFLNVHQIVNLRTTNIFLDFLAPALLSSFALYALWTTEGRDIAKNVRIASQRLRGSIASSAIANRCRCCMLSRRLPVAFLNLTHFTMRGPYNMLMLILVCQPVSLLSDEALHAWHVVTRMERAIFSLLPLLWILLQPEVTQALYRCACAVWRRSLGPARGGCSDGNEEVLWTLTGTTSLENASADVTITT